MESQPQNPQFRNNPENFHPWNYLNMLNNLTVEAYRRIIIICQSFFNLGQHVFNPFRTNEIFNKTTSNKVRMVHCIHVY